MTNPGDQPLELLPAGVALFIPAIDGILPARRQRAFVARGRRTDNGRPRRRRADWWAIVLAVVVFTALAVADSARAGPPGPGRILIDLAAGPVNTFNPDEAFGAVIDGLSRGRVDQVYTADNIQALKRAGLRSTVYMLRTELAIEAWHWSEEGVWSDRRRSRGYWTGSDHPRHPVLTAWGYRLPRRGDSIDQANDNGYSRLDDGDPATFWKSNPYLDRTYTGRPGRPQWVVLSFPGDTPVSAAHIQWAKPFARRYQVQYWRGVDPYDPQGRWIAFPTGRILKGRGGEVVLRLSDTPLRVRYVRVLLEASSHSAPRASRDRRDAMGYAIKEIGLGVIDPGGRFVDAVRHRKSGRDQTNIYVSSTDPWHRAIDRDPDVEQLGFDRVFSSGLTNGLPMLVSVGPLSALGIEHGSQDAVLGVSPWMSLEEVHPGRVLLEHLGQDPMADAGVAVEGRAQNPVHHLELARVERVEVSTDAVGLAHQRPDHGSR